MIARHIYDQILESVESRPVTLITGARQVGKSTIASEFEKQGFGYVSLDSARDRELANNDPDMFLQVHPWPLIIDEVQRAPKLFNTIEEIVNKEKRKRNDNYGMFILTGSQIYRLMKGITESLAGRVSIIHMMSLSRNEIINRDEPIFDFDVKNIQKRANDNPLTPLQLYDDIVRGFFPELYGNSRLKTQKFYANYVETYIERDVSDMINVKDKFLFRRFMELIASLTGEELIYENIAKTIGVDKKTVISWLSVLLAGDIVYLLEPYNEISISKRIVKRPKLYFSDTGLACYLTKLTSGAILQASAFSGRFVETYIINELKKSYINNGVEPNFYYYRDSNMNEIDLVIVQDGKLHRVECKSGINFNNSAVKGFKQLDKTNYQIGSKAIICNTDSIYPLDDGVYVLPLSGI